MFNFSNNCFANSFSYFTLKSNAWNLFSWNPLHSFERCEVRKNKSLWSDL